MKDKFTTVNNLIEGSQAYALTKIVNEQSKDKDIIFITSDNLKAKYICDSFNFLSNEESHLLLEWDAAAYDKLSPSKSIVDDRVTTLSNLVLSSKRKIVITTAQGFLHKTITPEEIKKYIFNIKVGDKIKRESLISQLTDSGYARASTANEPGSFAVRGSIVDIFDSGEDVGYRIDFFGDKVEYIKTFNPSTQITEGSIDSATILPSNELILSPKNIDICETSVVHEQGTNALKLEVLNNLKAGIRPSGIEQWLPLFYQEVKTVLAYVKDPVIILDIFIENKFSECMEVNERRYKEVVGELSLNKVKLEPLKPEQLFVSEKDLKEILSYHSLVQYNLGESSKSGSNFGIERIASLDTKSDSLKNLKEFINTQYKKQRSVIVSCMSEGSRDRVEKIFSDYDVAFASIQQWTAFKFKPLVNLIVGPFENGFICEEFALLTEQDIFGKKIVNLKSKKRSDLKALISESQNFTIGELVVHKEYGIGRFEGLETVCLSNTKHDCLKITYADNDKLFVPVENLELVTKYGNEEDGVKLDKLGTVAWQTRKARIKERVKEAAKYLLEIAAKRAMRKADIIESNPGIYEEFCATFPYAETDDQETAINDVRDDIRRGIPMDRLICGDVGFGKTEVAIRAAFLAVKAKLQVAIVCPTTILALQHYKQFNKRLSKFGIKVGSLSRLVPRADAKRFTDELESGDLDLVIGTHSVLSDKIKFKNLGMLIVDEEQHFGVAQKEKLKLIKENIHVLSMSATPIPRTLQMSMVGIRDLSLIATPPINRLVTKTNVISFDAAIVKEALMREKARGGQSFYICPRISDIPEELIKLSQNIPELKVGVAHGRMNPKDIDKVITDFYNGAIDVLLSTSIVESGLDIPTANTMIITKSDKFGLSQLYQLRGRVGRSNIQSYVYFTIPANKTLNPIAFKRMQILQAIDQLGSGFMVATSDMDLRGYGNLVGETQSGHIKEVGIELYQSMLEEAIKQNRSGEESAAKSNDSWTPQINIGTSVLIPEEYIPDFDIRLNLYKRASELKTEEDINSFAAEMVDRFGKLPQEVEYLLVIIKLKILCFAKSIQKLDASENAIVIKFAEDDTINFEHLMKSIQNHPDKIKLRPDNKLVINKAITDPNRRIRYLEQFIRGL